MNKLFQVILAFPKSLIYNLIAFDLRTAVKMPLIVGTNTRICGISKGTIRIDGVVRPGMLTVGIWEGSNYLGAKMATTLELEPNAEFSLSGRVSFAKGSHIFVGNQGRLQIGKNFIGNYGLHIVCRKKINIADEVLVSWKCLVMDNDGHEIYNSKQQVQNNSKTVEIGNHVWIGCNTSIYKGVRIADNCVIGANSVIKKSCLESENIYVSRQENIKVTKENIDWKI